MPRNFCVRVARGNMSLTRAIILSEFSNDCWTIGYKISPQKVRLKITTDDDLGNVLLVFSSKVRATDFIGTNFLADPEKIAPHSIELERLLSGLHDRIDAVLMDVTPVVITVRKTPKMIVNPQPSQ